MSESGVDAPEKYSFARNLRLVWAFRRYAAPFVLPAVGLLILALFQADLASTAAMGTNRLLNSFNASPPPPVAPANSVTATAGNEVFEIPMDVAKQYARPAPPRPAAAPEPEGGRMSPSSMMFDRMQVGKGSLGLAMLIALMLILALGIRLWGEQVRGIINQKFRHRVQIDLVDAMSRELAETRAARDLGNSSQIFLNDANGLSSVLVFGLVSAVESILMIVVYAINLSQLQKGGILLFGLFPLLLLFQMGLAKIFNPLGARAIEKSEGVNVQMRSRAAEFFDVLGRLVYFKGERSQAERLLGLSAESARTGRRFQFITSLGGGIEQLATTLALPLVVIVLSLPVVLRLFPGGSQSAGAIVEAQILLGLLTASTGSLIAVPSMLSSYAPALRRVRAALDIPSAGPRPAELDQLKVVATPKLEVRDLSFRYRGAQADTLRGVSFEIPAGYRVGLVAGSGGGKSTLARILLGDEMPASGGVFFNGVDITRWHLWWRRELIGFLPAEQGFLRGTLEENVLFGRSRDEVRNYEDALAVSGVATMAEKKGGMGYSIPKRVEDVLSTGERRRIGIARLLAGDQPLWIFDEPGAGLDQQEMWRIARDLVAATQGRTSIIITHDPDVFITDSIVFLLDGTIADVGPHADLLARNPQYRDLVTRHAEERTEQDKAKEDLEVLSAKMKDLEAMTGGLSGGAAAPPSGPPGGPGPRPRSGKVPIVSAD